MTQIVDAVADAVIKYAITALVVDPVLVSTSGHSLACSAASQAIVRRYVRAASKLSAQVFDAGNLLLTCERAQRLQVDCAGPCRVVISYPWHKDYSHDVCCDSCHWACRLLPLATVLTPNLAEASALLNGRAIRDLEGMKAAARELHALGPRYVFLKGGHLPAGACKDTTTGTMANILRFGMHCGIGFNVCCYLDPDMTRIMDHTWII